MRIIIYGDLHGCIEEFQSLREKVAPTADDREIIIGDILDKGPMSNELLRYVRNNKIESIMGNHEYKYVRYAKHEKKSNETGKKNPMQFDEDRLKIYNGLDEEDLQYLESLPLFLKIDNLTLIHAGILNNINLENATKKELEKLLWIRYLKDEHTPLSLGSEDETSTYWSELYDGKQGFIIYGHQPFEEVKKDKHSLGIDTGCVFGNKLTAAIFTKGDVTENLKLVQVQAKKEYSKIYKATNDNY
nr:metallophosphoesterase [Sulfurimonas sp. SAG-AH-194-C21]